MSTTAGTVKVGRWTYPATLATNDNDFPTVDRNTKRDGSGETVRVTDQKVIDTFAPDEAQSDAASPEIPGFTDDDVNLDYDDLRAAYAQIFDDFAVTYDEISSAIGAESGRTRAIVAMLVDAKLVTTELRSIDGSRSVTPGSRVPSETIIQSWKTYDDHTKGEVMADFDAAFDHDVRIRKTSGHGGKIGAQTKKPGRSTWEVGTPCPQGHILEEGDIYTMPSGRHQCRKCRGSYASNDSAAS